MRIRILFSLRVEQLRPVRNLIAVESFDGGHPWKILSPKVAPKTTVPICTEKTWGQNSLSFNPGFDTYKILGGHHSGACAERPRCKERVTLGHSLSEKRSFVKQPSCWNSQLFASFAWVDDDDDDDDDDEGWRMKDAGWRTYDERWTRSHASLEARRFTCPKCCMAVCALDVSQEAVWTELHRHAEAVGAPLAAGRVQIEPGSSYSSRSLGAKSHAACGALGACLRMSQIHFHIFHLANYVLEEQATTILVKAEEARSENRGNWQKSSVFNRSKNFNHQAKRVRGMLRRKHLTIWNRGCRQGTHKEPRARHAEAIRVVRMAAWKPREL